MIVSDRNYPMGSEGLTNEVNDEITDMKKPVIPKNTFFKRHFWCLPGAVIHCHQFLCKYNAHYICVKEDIFITSQGCISTEMRGIDEPL